MPAGEPAGAQADAAAAQADPHAGIGRHTQAGQPAQPEPLTVASTSAPAQAQAQGGEGRAATYVPDITFTLRTDIAEGKLVFVGVGGDIDGMVNPELHVAPNSVVQVTLVNGDGAQHDWAIPDPNAKTELITGRDASSVTVFRVGEDGTFTYLCTVPGHQAAGMEGKLVVGEGQQGEGEALDVPSIVRAPTSLTPSAKGDLSPTTSCSLPPRSKRAWPTAPPTSSGPSTTRCPDPCCACASAIR